MENQLILLIGSPGTSLKRVKDKTSRRLILHLIKQGLSDPLTQIRAYLSISRFPPSPLLTADNIRQALALDDCVNFLHFLSKKTSVLDPQSALDVISGQVSRGRPASAVKLIVSLARTANKWLKRATKVEIREESVWRFFSIVEVLFSDVTDDTRKQLMRSRGAIKATRSLCVLSVLWAMKSKNPDDVLLALRVQIPAGKLGVCSEESLGEEYHSALDALITRAEERLRQLAVDGALSEFQSWAEVLRRLPFGEARLSETLKALYSERAQFQDAVQRSIRELLGIGGIPEGQGVFTSKGADSLQAVQLGAVMLRSWAARNEGPKAKDAFEELRSVLRGFFGLELRGNEGDVDSFNPRVHEFAYGEKQSSRVELIRPWVEYVAGDDARVIIKALVKPRNQT